MLKAAVGNVAFLGLEKMNVEKLKEGLPMVIRLKDIGLPDIAVAIAVGKKFSVETPSSGNPLVMVHVSDETITSLKNGEERIFEMKIMGADYKVVLLYGDTTQIIAANIEKNYDLKMPVINPVNTKPI